MQLPHGSHYTYWPDGTLGAVPSHGTVFVHYADKSTWVWNNLKKQWIKNMHNYSEIKNQGPGPLKCECGASAVKSSNHTSWCPIF